MRVVFCFLFIIIISGNVFCQNFDLLLSPNDIRLESSFLDGKEIFYLYIRKKQNIESVMLTEPTGLHSLRSIEWNTINGDERRELNRKVINDAYSRFSILSSTPIPDRQFGKAFQLLIPSKVVYGNPLSSAGVIFIGRDDDVQINIRTFDHKFADPNIGRFQNNTYIISDIYDRTYPVRESKEPESNGLLDPSIPNDLYLLRKELERIGVNKDTLKEMKDYELKEFLRNSFVKKSYGK